MKKFWISILIVIAVFLIWLRFFHKKAQPQYTTAKAVRGTLTSQVEATGTLEPVGTTSVDSSGTVSGGITVGAQVTGRITKVYVDYNSRVKKGQLLAQIDPLSYQAAVDQDEANITNIASQKLKDEATLANDKLQFGRETQLVAKNYDSKQNLDNAKYAYEAQKSAVAADAAQIKQAQARLMQDQANLSYTQIVSPVDGIVIANNTSVGQTVVASFQSPSLFVIAKSLKDMQIDTLVDEADVNKIKIGQEATFNVDAYPATPFKGKVAQIRNNPIQQQNVVDYDVIVYVSNPGEKLLPGMTANVSFITRQKTGVLMIPNRALLFSPPQRKRSANAAGFTTSLIPKKTIPHVYLLQDGKLVRKNIKTGIANDTDTEVLSGLNEGDEVVTATAVQTAKKNPFSTF